MPRRFSIPFAILALTITTFAQQDIQTFKAEATNAFVWGEENRSAAVSSSVQDPITGNTIRKLKHAGIEVSSRAGFEKVGNEELLSFTTTVVNATKDEIVVRQGGLSVDGHVALPLSVVLKKKDVAKKERKQAWELVSMRCFANGFLPNEEFFSANGSATGFTVTPNETVTVAFVTKDPRFSSIACSVEGCYPKGSMRFAVVVNATVFVFVWPGRAMVACGS
jgi:hypothetical protein